MFSNKLLIRLLYNFTLLTVASIPLDGLSIEFGATLKLSRVFGMLAVFALVIYLGFTSDKSKEKFPKSFSFVFNILCLFFLVTWLSNLIFLTEIIKPEAQDYFLQKFGSDGASILRTVLKPFQAFIANAINFSWLLIPILVIRSNLQVMQIAWVYVISSSVQALLGITQYLYFLVSGINLFPIYRRGLIGGYTQDAYVDLQGISFLRVNALAGEPKHLALVLGFGIGITIFLLVGNHKNKIITISCLCFQMVALMLTFSSLGYAVIISVIFVYLVFSKNKLALFPILGITLVMYSFLFDVPSFLVNLFEERILERIGFEDFDLVYISFIQDSPSYLFFGTGFGNFHLASFEQASQILLWDFGIILPKLGLFSILATSGFVGLCLFLILLFNLFCHLNIIAKSKCLLEKNFYNDLKKLLTFMIITGVVLRLTIFGILWLGIGFAVIENSKKYLNVMKLSAQHQKMIEYYHNY